MEKNPMCRPYTRPYQTTCGMNRSKSDCMQPRTMQQNRTTNESNCVSTRNRRIFGTEMYEHIDQMAPAMAYVPCQQFNNTYDLCYALSVGTIFPELCKPFCGKRGVRKC